MQVKIHEDRIDAIEKISERLEFRVGSGRSVGPKQHDVRVQTEDDSKFQMQISSSDIAILMNMKRSTTKHPSASVR